MLRELELLPVWQLRKPMPVADEMSPAKVDQEAPVEKPKASQEGAAPVEVAPVHQVPKVQNQTAHTQPFDTHETVAVAAESEAVSAASSPASPTLDAPKPAHQFRLLTSDDGQWAFVLAANASEEAEVLLRNMIKAVSVTIKQDAPQAEWVDLAPSLPKVIVVMGEQDAQQLLDSQQTLEQLRGQAHLYQGVPVVATYSPSHLLDNLADKANAWQDLCLAKFTIANL